MAEEVLQTGHFEWAGDAQGIEGLAGQVHGKKDILNNFCIGVPSNEGRCTHCHAGYGWADSTFDFEDPENIDCLVCHDTTGTYKKLPGLSGHPNYKTIEWPPHSGKFRPPTDLKKVAQNVGPTSRKTCGTCQGDDDCRDVAAGFCELTGGVCVECLEGSACTAPEVCRGGSSEWGRVGDEGDCR